MQARLLDIRGLKEDLLPPLQLARVLTIKEGGVLIDGQEIHTRGSKSKAERRRQTWWCMVNEEEAFAALERMEPKSYTGFSVNDDEE